MFFVIEMFSQKQINHTRFTLNAFSKILARMVLLLTFRASINNLNQGLEAGKLALNDNIES